MGKIDWKEVNEKYFKLVRPVYNPVAIKHCTGLDEITNYPGAQTYNWANPICGAIGRCGFENVTLVVEDKNYLSDYCRGINGMKERDEKWHSGESHVGGWFDNLEASKSHHDALKCLPPIYKATIVSSLGTGAIEEPDVICMNLTPGRTFFLMAGYVHRKHEVVDFTFVGESGCSDSWNTTLLEGKVGLSFGCRGERSYGQMEDDNLRISMTPDQFMRAIDGMEGLVENGITYPFTGEGLYSDICNSPSYQERYGFFIGF